jgi:hypothetical protein
MHLIVDHAWQQELACGVNHLGPIGRRYAGIDPGDPLALYQDVCVANFTLIDETRVRNQ